MSAASIVNSIKVCRCVVSCRLDEQVMQLQWDKVLEIIEHESNKPCIASIAELSPEVQAVLLSNVDAMKLYNQLYNCDADVYRSDELFRDKDFIDSLGRFTVEEISTVLDNIGIPENFMFLALQHPEILEKDDYCAFWAGCGLIMDKSSLSYEWCCQHYSLVASDIIIKTGLLCKLEHYEDAVQAIADSDELYDFMVILQKWSTVCMTEWAFVQIRDNLHKLLPDLKWVLEQIPEEKRNDFVHQWIQNAMLVRDLSVLKQKATSIQSWDFLDSRLRYVAFCYSETLDFDVEEYQENLVVYAIQNKKKAFIRLLRQNSELFKTIGVKSLLYYPEFYEECININTLNQADLSSLAGMAVSKYKVERLAHNDLTFKEFKVLYASRGEVIELYYNLGIKSVDRRLEIIREFNGSVTCLTDESIKKLPEYLRLKKLSDWRNEEFGHIKQINYNTVVELLTYYGDLQKFVKDIKDRAEAQRICKNIQVYKDMQSIMDIRESVVGTDEDWLHLKSRVQLTDEFVNQNRDSITEFIMRNGAYIAYKYLCQNMQSLNDLKKLVIAELLGRFDEVKYPEDGLTRELGVVVGKKVYQIWKNNSEVNAGALKVWEEDRFIPVMQIGEVPVHTCLSYKNGGYSECLLSCFDTSKKILFVSRGDDIVLRAVVRFTKGVYKVQDKRDIAFIDVTGQKSRGSFLLFLEKAYCTVEDPAEQYKYFKLMFDMLHAKAKKMGAILVCSKYYSKWQDFLMQINYNLYISASKVGQQYLDSLSGKVSINDESRYYETKVLIHKDDMQLLQ